MPKEKLPSLMRFFFVNITLQSAWVAVTTCSVQYVKSITELLRARVFVFCRSYSNPGNGEADVLCCVSVKVNAHQGVHANRMRKTCGLALHVTGSTVSPVVGVCW